MLSTSSEIFKAVSPSVLQARSCNQKQIKIELHKMLLAFNRLRDLTIVTQKN